MTALNTRTTRIGNDDQKTIDKLAWELAKLTEGERYFYTSDVIHKILKYLDANDITPQALLDGTPATSKPTTLEPAIQDAVKQISHMAQASEAQVINHLLDFALNQKNGYYEEIAREINKQ